MKTICQAASFHTIAISLFPSVCWFHQRRGLNANALWWEPGGINFSIQTPESLKGFCFKAMCGEKNWLHFPSFECIPTAICTTWFLVLGFARTARVGALCLHDSWVLLFPYYVDKAAAVFCRGLCCTATLVGVWTFTHIQPNPMQVYLELRAQSKMPICVDTRLLHWCKIHSVNTGVPSSSSALALRLPDRRCLLGAAQIYAAVQQAHGLNRSHMGWGQRA